jgi:hypothetical protein
MQFRSAFALDLVGKERVPTAQLISQPCGHAAGARCRTRPGPQCSGRLARGLSHPALSRRARRWSL